MFEDGEYCEEPRTVAFSELYSANAHIFYLMTSVISYLVVENNLAYHNPVVSD